MTVEYAAVLMGTSIVRILESKMLQRMAFDAIRMGEWQDGPAW
jgi:hypothetical protein